MRSGTKKSERDHERYIASREKRIAKQRDYYQRNRERYLSRRKSPKRKNVLKEMFENEKGILCELNIQYTNLRNCGSVKEISLKTDLCDYPIRNAKIINEVLSLLIDKSSE